MVQRIFDQTEILKISAYVGHKVPEMNDEKIRQLIEGNYRIIYEVHSENEVEVLTVFHGARLLQNKLEL